MLYHERLSLQRALKQRSIITGWNIERDYSHPETGCYKIINTAGNSSCLFHPQGGNHARRPADEAEPPPRQPSPAHLIGEREKATLTTFASRPHQSRERATQPTLQERPHHVAKKESGLLQSTGAENRTFGMVQVDSLFMFFSPAEELLLSSSDPRGIEIGLGNPCWQ